jgi:hypothetical protein
LDQYMIITTDRGELFSQAEYGLGIGTAQTEQDILAKAKKRLGMR